ncbi:MAG: hypothetical protein NC218_02185 [Acetobacter sp.]|nr:hypothetical protein [Acetobacter sp.]
MKVIRQPFKYFGHRCKSCGAYMIYDMQDINIGEFTCPCCYESFTHDITRDDIDCEPDLAALGAIANNDEEAFIASRFHVGDKVYVAYDAYYSNEPDHTWKIKDEAVTIDKITAQESAGKTEVTYHFDEIIYHARDPRQYCQESDISAVPFLDKDEAIAYAKRMTQLRKKESKC